MYIDEIKNLSGGRVLVCIDGEPAFALYKKELDSFGLSPDRELHPHDMERIMEHLQKRAVMRAMKILERTDKSESELRSALERGYYPATAIDAAIAYVSSYGYIDDERYARSFIEYRLEKKTRRELAAELSKRGIDEQVFMPILEELCPEDETDLVRSLIRKKYPGGIPDMTDEKQKAKLYRYLMGRGCSYGDIKRVLEDIDP